MNLSLAILLQLATVVLLWRLSDRPMPNSERIDARRWPIYLVLPLLMVGLFFLIEFGGIGMRRLTWTALYFAAISLLYTVAVGAIHPRRVLEAVSVYPWVSFVLLWPLAHGGSNVVTHGQAGGGWIVVLSLGLCLVAGVFFTWIGLRLRRAGAPASGHGAGLAFLLYGLGYSAFALYSAALLLAGDLNWSLEALGKHPVVPWMISTVVCSLAAAYQSKRILEHYGHYLPRDEDHHRYRGSIWSRAEDAASARSARPPAQDPGSAALG